MKKYLLFITLILTCLFITSCASTCTIKYDLTGYKYDTKEEEYNLGSSITLPQYNDYDEAGYHYKFVGWKSDAGDIYKKYMNASKSQTLYAVFDKECITYQITYNLGDYISLTFTPEHASYTVEDNFVLEKVDNNEADFIGWYLEANFQTRVEKASDLGFGDKTLYALFTDKSYQINYHLNDGTLDNLLTSYKEGDEITLRNPSKLGYTFNGWYLNSDYSGNSITKIDASMKGDIDLYAKYTLDKYTITYQIDNGTLENAQVSYSYFDSFTLKTPVKPGYKFLGWYDNKAFNGNSITEIKLNSTTNYVLYAKYEIINYSLKMLINNVVYKEIFINVESSITLDIPTKDKYQFNGWYKKSDLSGEKVLKITKGNTGDLILYGEFINIQETVSLSVELNGGKLSTSFAGTYSQKENVLLTAPTKDNYIFVGWYDNKNYNGECYYSNYVINNNVTLFARYVSMDEVVYNTVGEKLTKSLSASFTYEEIPGLTISFESSNQNILANNGYLNQSHKVESISVKFIFNYKNTSYNYTKQMSVSPVVFDDLIKGKSVFGYLYSGSMYQWQNVTFENLFTETALKTIDVMYYGFATVSDDGHLVINKDNFDKRMNIALKLRQYGIRVVLCIGSNPYNFSKMAGTQTGINTFVAEVIKFVEDNHFDGVDIDWEFPGVNSAYSVEVDRPNYTSLIKTLRTSLDAAQASGGTNYLLTAAIPGTSWGSARYEMDVLDNYLDYVNMMSYDLNNESVACHHTSPYTSTIARGYGFSVDNGVSLFTSKGFNKAQIIAGMAFYGKYYTNATTLGASATYKSNLVYTKIKQNYLTNSDFQQLFDDSAKAPYLLNTKTGEFICYDDERSIKYKCQYANNNGLMGVMFWDYSEDTTHTLVNAIYEQNKKA